MGLEGSTLGSYFVSVYSHHYDWAMKKLKGTYKKLVSHEQMSITFTPTIPVCRGARMYRYIENYGVLNPTQNAICVVQFSIQTLYK